MEKIIVPTDFSECAKNALKVAAGIARKARAEIHLVHVFEHSFMGFTDSPGDKNIRMKIYDRAVQELNQLANLPFMKRIKTHQHLFANIKIWEAISQKKLAGASLIVIGSHGISGWRELFIGSNTEKVVRYANIPVLVIKEGADNFEINNMVFASDFLREADASFFKIENFTRIFVARIHLLKVITPGNFEPSHISFNLMRDFVRRFQLTDFTINTYNDNTIEEGVLNFSRQKRADLISMETHGRTGLAHLISGSLTEKIANHISLPVLSIKINYKPLRTVVQKSEVEELNENY